MLSMRYIMYLCLAAYCAKPLYDRSLTACRLSDADRLRPATVDSIRSARSARCLAMEVRKLNASMIAQHLPCICNRLMRWTIGLESLSVGTLFGGCTEIYTPRQMDGCSWHADGRRNASAAARKPGFMHAHCWGRQCMHRAQAEMSPFFYPQN